MGIREITAAAATTTATTTTTTTGGVAVVHHLGAIEAGTAPVPTIAATAAAEATPATYRPAKQERTSLKRLHSLRDQLFCGFKSLAATSSERPQQQAQFKSKPKPTDAQEVLGVSRCSRQLVADGPNNIDCGRTMIVDQNNANPARAGPAISIRGQRASRSSSWASLANQQQQQVPFQLRDDPHTRDQPTMGDLLQVLGQSSPTSNECTSKRASFRRFTGRSSASGTTKLAPNVEPPDRAMIRLIERLDQLTRATSMGQNEDERPSPEEDVFRLEKSWTHFVRLKVDDNQPESTVNASHDSAPNETQTRLGSLRIQQDAIWELLTSEVFYLKRLRVILVIFFGTLVKLQQDSLLLEIDATRLMSNIEEVYLANYGLWTNHLLPMLMRSRQSGCPLDPSSLKDAFVQVRNLFGAYYQYCLEHTACLDYLRDRNKHNQYFKVYLAWCESQKDCERLRLMDLLAKPMQRLTKYPLLLKAIHRRTDNPKQLDHLRAMIDGMEKFVLTVDLRLRDGDELELLSSTADRIEALDIGSSDAIYCDEVNRIIAQHNRSFHLCGPLFECSHGCTRRLLLDSSQQHANNLGQLKFKDPQLNSKVDIVLLLFTDQLMVCRQISHRWFSPPQNMAGQERSPIKSSIYNKSFSSLGSRGKQNRRQNQSTKQSSGSPQSGWIKSRSGSGNHLVDSLSLANELRHTNSDTTDCGQQPASFHLSTSSLAGSAAREHFIVSKSADTSRSGESSIPSPNRAWPSLQSSRLRAIRSPYPIDRLALHELNDGQRIFCCQLNDSGTIATSFILHTNGPELSRNPNQQQQQQQHSGGATTLESGRSEPDSALHHLSPIRSGLSKRCKQQQSMISPARRLINLIEEARLQYKAAAHFHGLRVAPIEANCAPNRDRQAGCSSNKTSSTSRSSELLVELGNWASLANRDESSLARDNHNSKALIEQEQSMLLKHGRYDELQTCNSLHYMLARTNLPAHQDPTATGTFVSPLLSVSIDDGPKMIVRAPSQNSVFETELNQAKTAQSVDSQPGAEPKPTANATHSEPHSESEKMNHCSWAPQMAIMRPAPDCISQSWSCCGANRRPSVAISGSDVESMAGAKLPPTAAIDREPSSSSKFDTAAATITEHGNHRRQTNHLRRQDDIITFSHDQQENVLQAFGQACCHGQPTLNDADSGPDPRVKNNLWSASVGQTNDNQPGQHHRYLSLARRLMQEGQSSSSQATTMESQTSITLTDTRIDSTTDLEETSELANPRARVPLGQCNAGDQLSSSSSSVGARQQFSENHTDDNRPDSLDRGQIYLEIPSKVRASSRTNRFRCARSTGGMDSSSVDESLSQPAGVSRPNDNQVSVPILNVTSADSHPPKRGSNLANQAGAFRAPAHANREIRMSTLGRGANLEDSRTSSDCDDDCLVPGGGSFDGNLNYRGNLLELKCIHKLIHQDEHQEGACGKIYLGFYEKLDLHLRQTSHAPPGGPSCRRSPEVGFVRTMDDCKPISTIGSRRQTNKTVHGRQSPASSDSSASRNKIKSIRMFTNDLIGSLIRATSSCSVYSRN